MGRWLIPRGMFPLAERMGLLLLLHRHAGLGAFFIIIFACHERFSPGGPSAVWVAGTGLLLVAVSVWFSVPGIGLLVLLSSG